MTATPWYNNPIEPLFDTDLLFGSARAADHVRPMQCLVLLDYSYVNTEGDTQTIKRTALLTFETVSYSGAHSTFRIFSAVTDIQGALRLPSVIARKNEAEESIYCVDYSRLQAAAVGLTRLQVGEFCSPSKYTDVAAGDSSAAAEWALTGVEISRIGGSSGAYKVEYTFSFDTVTVVKNLRSRWFDSLPEDWAGAAE